MVNYLTIKKWTVINLSLIAILAVCFLFALNTGSEKIDLYGALTTSGVDHSILFTARLPRILLALLVGLALSSSGCAFQTLLRNPLADPFILGISGGAALGSILAVGLKLSVAYISILAFVGTVFAMITILLFSGQRGRLDTTRLLLTGVIFNAFCFSLILFVNAVVTMEEAYQILFMLIGNLETVSYTTIAYIAGFIIVGFIGLILLSRKLNLLSLGDSEARALGINLRGLRIAVFTCASIMVGAAVSVSGLIGFVGLFIPHTMRLLFGADNRLLIPASGLAGAAFLIIADTLARTVLMDTGFATELPVGVITAMIGAPFFMILLRQRSMKIFKR